MRCAAPSRCRPAWPSATRTCAEDQRIEFRIGINVGDIVEQDGDIFGDGVNIAARLEGIAEPAGSASRQRVQEDAAARLDLAFEDMGEQALKNIARPVRAYRVRLRHAGATSQSAVSADAGLPDKPSLAVLPFQNMSGDAEQEYFADGIVEDIITALSRFKSFAVIARNSSFVYKGRAVDVRQVAKELGVRYVLEGSVRRAGERLRITAQLVDGTSGAHLWADRFDGAVEDVFDVQDRITESVATIVEPQIREAEIERSRRERPESVAAYDLYLRALPKISRRDRQRRMPTAYALLSKAIALEPDNAVFLASALWALEHRIIMGWPTLDRRRPARLPATSRAAHLPMRTAMRRCWRSAASALGEHRAGLRTRAARSCANAVEANPNNRWSLTCAGIAKLHCGSLDDALAYIHRAIRLSPGDPTAIWPSPAIAHVHMILGNYAEALAGGGAIAGGQSELRPDLLDADRGQRAARPDGRGAALAGEVPERLLRASRSRASRRRSRTRIRRAWRRSSKGCGSPDWKRARWSAALPRSSPPTWSATAG